MAKAIEYDVIVVLGAQVKADGTASKALHRRLTLALARYQMRPVPIICCGAQGRNEPCAEGDFMRAWLMARGVPQAHALSEDGSYDTIENIGNARAIMEAMGATSALIVTSDYHVRRALAICRCFKIAAQGAGSPSERSYWFKNHAREALAWCKYILWRLGIV